jgi:hypothetical protein
MVPPTAETPTKDGRGTMDLAKLPIEANTRAEENCEWGSRQALNLVWMLPIMPTSRKHHRHHDNTQTRLICSQSLHIRKKLSTLCTGPPHMAQNNKNYRYIFISQ